ncbi:MAG: L-seryl-tRNA(Sec) selenium transferase, partial [Chloroflexota bacterium]
MKNELRQIPSVERLLQHPRAGNWAMQWGRALTLSAIRATLEEFRNSAVHQNNLSDLESVLDTIENRLVTWLQPSLRPVINATGVILHTNLGRAPLSQAALLAIQECAQGYATLEFDLPSGKRGTRDSHAKSLLTRLTGAEDALVVNNNAAAVLLALSALARRRAVIISRTQLVEIGGGFRIPEMMKQSGARLVEIGTTNRVHLRDYAQALKENPAALIMHVHHSNFRITGFTSEPTLAELVNLGHEFQARVLADQGSGALLDTAAFGLSH